MDFPKAFDIGEGTLYERFNSYVHRAADHQCWNWTGAITHATGYGQITEWVNQSRRNRSPHRLAWEFCFGPIPDGLLVRHMCHNRLCCNPTHLLLGTHKDNFEDKVRACRQGNSVMEKGELHPNAKLCERDVIAIRQSYGKTIYQLADQFGVSKSLIGAIRNNQIWTHLL